MAYATGTYVALAVFAAGTAVSVNQNKKAQAAQSNARDLEEAGQKAADAEMRRQRVREERIKRAQIIQFAEGSGVAASSGVEGATSSLGTQIGSSIAFQTGQQQNAYNIGDQNQKAADSLFRADTAGKIGNLGLSTLTQTSDFKSIFK